MKLETIMAGRGLATRFRVKAGVNRLLKTVIYPSVRCEFTVEAFQSRNKVWAKTDKPPINTGPLGLHTS